MGQRERADHRFIGDGGEPGQRVQQLPADAVPQEVPHDDGEPQRAATDDLLPGGLRPHRRAGERSLLPRPVPDGGPPEGEGGLHPPRWREGHGHYVGTYLGHGAFSPGWWGEGEIKFFIDGDTDFPTINGTGEEDYFLGSYGYAKRENNGAPRETNYSTAFAGFYVTEPVDWVTQYFKPGHERRYAQYRWHVMDPVRFTDDLKVTIQSLGWEGGERRENSGRRHVQAAGGLSGLGRVLVSGRAACGFPCTAVGRGDDAETAGTAVRAIGWIIWALAVGLLAQRRSALRRTCGRMAVLAGRSTCCRTGRSI